MIVNKAAEQEDIRTLALTALLHMTIQQNAILIVTISYVREIKKEWIICLLYEYTKLNLFFC